MSLPNARKIAFEVLMRVDGGAFADLALDAALERSPTMDPRDRALCTELVYGALRQRGRLDFALTRFSRKPLAKLEPRVLWLLRLGVHQILHLDKIPDSAAVNEAVSLARKIGLERATGFINGTLRSFLRERDTIPWPKTEKAQAYLQHVLSLPRWLAASWLTDFGQDEALRLGEAMLAAAPFTLRVNTLKISRQDYLELLQQAGWQGAATQFAPEGVTILERGAGSLPGSREGLCQVQDEASMLMAHLIAPKPGERILDACAAPGGKTTHLAALLENRGDIVALDLHPQRVELIRSGAERLGCQNIQARAWDLENPPDFLEPQSFDRILVDAPCSGLGVLRRNPEIRWRRQPEDIRPLAQLQQRILANVAPLLRPGGRLIYSLCTLTREESTEVREAFLASQSQFRAVDLRNEVSNHWQPLCTEDGTLQTFPHWHGGMDAFFAAAFERL